METRIDYKASCHCGRVRFCFRSPPITRASRCDCSLCVRRAAWLSPSYIPAADFTPHANPSDLECYRWNAKVLGNHFCRHCGIFVYIADGENGKDGYRVNLGCVEGLDVFRLEVKRIAGSALPVAGH
jgi:hypothetical protein